MKRYLLAAGALFAVSLWIIRKSYGIEPAYRAGQLYILGVFLLCVSALTAIHCWEIMNQRRDRSRANHPTNHRTH